MCDMVTDLGLETRACPPAVSQAGCVGEQHWRGQACWHREVSVDSWVPWHPTRALVQGGRALTLDAERFQSPQAG